MLASNRTPPLRFLAGVLLSWAVLRVVLLYGWPMPSQAPLRWGRGGGWLHEQAPRWPGLTARAAPRLGTPERLAHAGGAARRPPAQTWRTANEPLTPHADEAESAFLALAAYRPDGTTYYARSPGAPAVSAATGSPQGELPDATASRWSGSAWAFVRSGGHARPLSPDGQIGASQAGARILYRLEDGIAAAARLSRTIGGPDQTEAAFGLDWQPVAHVPVHVMLDRRVAIDHGGRDAWSLGAAGGVYAVALAPGWRLDGYGEAGVVGARRRDLYADGAVRAGRELALGGSRSLTIGGGAWGAAQPRAARLDIGPSAVLRLPVGGRTIGIALDYRGRVTGSALPHSGVALTTGIDF